MASSPLVAVIMGSTSDWETMRHAAEVLERSACRYEKHVVSAHRTPEWMAEFAQAAEAAGFEVIIAGAGGAAHLPGMTAAHTALPVLGVPVQSAALNGLDSLLSIVQMPGGVPVGTLAIGKAGATNAGLLAVAILALSRPDLRERLHAFRAEQTQGARGPLAVTVAILPGATIGVLGSGQLGRMLAMAARAWATACTRYSPAEDTPTGQVADLEIAADYDDLDAVRAFAKGVDVVTFEFENVSTEAAAAAAELVPVRPSGRRCTSRSSAREKRRFSPIAAFRPRRFARCATLDELAVALGRSACRPSSRPRHSATTARASTASSRSRTPSASGV